MSVIRKQFSDSSAASNGVAGLKHNFSFASVPKAAFAFACFLSLLLTGCISTSNYQAWDGPSEFTGPGGAFVTKDGIDIYSSGAPKRKCRIIGIIKASTMSSAEMMTLFGDSWSTSKLVKEAKARGGNAVIITDDRMNLLGWSSSGSATVYQSGNTATAYRSNQTSANVSRERIAVLVKYMDSNNTPSASQNVLSDVQTPTVAADKRIETALIGHWVMVGHKGQANGAWAEKVEITVLPDNRFETASTQNGKLYSIRGKYTVKGDTLTIVSDQTSAPDTFAFSLIQNHLVIRPNGNEMILQRTEDPK